MINESHEKFLDLMPHYYKLYICLRQGLKHVKPKLLIQNQPRLFSSSYFRFLPPDLPYHQSLTLVSSTVSLQNNGYVFQNTCNVLRKYLDLMPPLL